MKRPHFPRSPVHTALWIDAAFELVAGAVLLVLHSSVASWLDVDGSVAAGAGVIFLLAAAVIVGTALKPAPWRRLVTALATFNLTGGIAIWCVLPFVWSSINPEGRWMASAAADSFIAVAALEYLAIRRAGAPSGPTE